MRCAFLPLFSTSCKLDLPREPYTKTWYFWVWGIVQIYFKLGLTHQVCPSLPASQLSSHYALSQQTMSSLDTFNKLVIYELPKKSKYGLIYSINYSSLHCVLQSLNEIQDRFLLQVNQSRRKINRYYMKTVNLYPMISQRHSITDD